MTRDRLKPGLPTDVLTCSRALIDAVLTAGGRVSSYSHHMAWTADQVLALAPDPSSAKSGKDLGVARKWKTLGVTDACAWGTLQGSGKDPYQTCIDLTGPAFKCTCPSRKFPCKHGLGLFLVLAQQPTTLTEKTPPAWAAEWLAKRVEKEEKKVAQESAPPAPEDPEAAAKAAAAAEKRAANREARVTAGLEELGTWLGDLVRTGFASLPGKPPTFWETPAARLIDAQAPGLARRVSALEGITTEGDQWPATLLREASRIHLVREGWSRWNSLTPGTQADLRSVLGFPVAQADLMSQEGVRDQWLVLGRRVLEEEGLRTQRIWLWGRRHARPALSLSFSAGPNQPLDVGWVPGTELEAELVFFPSAAPLRALVKQRLSAATPAGSDLPHRSLAEAAAYAAEWFRGNPWTERVPLALAAVIPLRRGQGWWVRDSAGDGWPLALTEASGWKLMAASGGRPVGLTGEWDGEVLTPLALESEGGWSTL